MRYDQRRDAPYEHYLALYGPREDRWAAPSAYSHMFAGAVAGGACPPLPHPGGLLRTHTSPGQFQRSAVPQIAVELGLASASTLSPLGASPQPSVHGADPLNWRGASLSELGAPQESRTKVPAPSQHCYSKQLSEKGSSALALSAGQAGQAAKSIATGKVGLRRIPDAPVTLIGAPAVLYTRRW